MAATQFAQLVDRRGVGPLRVWDHGGLSGTRDRAPCRRSRTDVTRSPFEPRRGSLVKRAARAGAGHLSGRPLRTYGAERTCSKLACTTRLSRYNSRATCFLHTQLVPNSSR